MFPLVSVCLYIYIDRKTTLQNKIFNFAFSGKNSHSSRREKPHLKFVARAQADNTRLMWLAQK